MPAVGSDGALVCVVECGCGRCAKREGDRERERQRERERERERERDQREIRGDPKKVCPHRVR